MHYANIKKPELLQRLLKVLRKRRWYSTLELFEKAKVCAISSAVSELRRNGFGIDCRRKGDVYEYRLAA